MTIASLRSLAKARTVKLRPTLKKKEIIDLLIPLFLMNEKPASAAPASPKIQVKPDLQKKKEKKPALTGHAGEGEVHDEKVTLTLSPNPEIPKESPYAEIPKEYQENRIVLLVRDPEWVHAYWEVTPDALGEANRRLADPEAHLTLRIYDMTEWKDLTYFWDIEIYQRIGNWYLHVGRPDRTYLTDVGMKSRTGAFATIARSNPGHTPPSAPSSRFDEEWWTVEWDQEIVIAPFDEGRRLPSVRVKEEAEGGGSHLLPLSRFGREEA